MGGGGGGCGGGMVVGGMWGWGGYGTGETHTA